MLSGNEQVVLNVGGVSFTTTQMTLQNAPAPSLFAAMFSGRHTLKADAVRFWAQCNIVCVAHDRNLHLLTIVCIAQNGHYFLDRDGRHFHDILNYLRVRMELILCMHKAEARMIRRATCPFASDAAQYESWD